MMAMILHEIWEQDLPNGVLPSVCLAGPDGDACRALLPKTARLVRTYEAGSHFEAMTIYYQHYGWGDYTTDIAWDREPYPQEWSERQRST